MFWTKFILKISILPVILFGGISYFASGFINEIYYKTACVSLVSVKDSKFEAKGDACKFKNMESSLTVSELKAIVDSGSSGLLEIQQTILTTMDAMRIAMLFGVLVGFIANLSPKIFRRIEELDKVKKEEFYEMFKFNSEQNTTSVKIPPEQRKVESQSEEEKQMFEKLKHYRENKNAPKNTKKFAKSVNKIYI